MAPLDKTDEAILDVLKANARLSTREVARRSGIPPATVHKRMIRLEKEGIIQGYTVKIDYEKIGKVTVAYILVRTKPGANYTEMMESLSKNQAVEDIGALAGEFDIILKVRTESIKDLDKFIFDSLHKFKDVTQTQTLIVFRGWKRQ